MRAPLLQFLKDALRSATTGGRKYHIWMGLLTFLMLLGAHSYYIQLRDGLATTGMNDHVSWGLYISNFTFLVGVAAASVMLVLPAYVLHDVDFPKAVLIGEGVAVAALFMCLGFVTVDMGSPHKIWHMIPFIGYMNFPRSMLTWDVIVLNGYLVLNLVIPFYILFAHYRSIEPDKKKYVPFIFLSVFWAISIHLVTAFLYAGLPARPFWYSALMGPRFLASAFSAGPALIILILQMIKRHTDYDIQDKTLDKLALITTVASQVSLVMLASELFKEFYYPTEHSQSAIYLFKGLGEHNALVPWMWTSLGLTVMATGILMVHKLRQNYKWLTFACVTLFLGIWIEKGLGVVVPGFIPGPLGDVVDYFPTLNEVIITLGIWAMGSFIFSILVKVAIPIEMGKLRLNSNRVK